MSNAITIQQGFPGELRFEAAGLYDAAFGAKLSIAIPDKELRLAVLREAFNPNFCFVAMSGGELVGIAGFNTTAGSLTGGMTFGELYALLGLVKALRAILVLALFERKLTKGELLMDGISVSPKMRGNGIGSSLLRRLMEYARIEGYRTLRLDVIDTNPPARRLYERLGFVATSTAKFGYLRWLLGFGAATTMEYSVHAGA
ncbi:MAG: GNAT family N-acetyltransferase [Anaerolineales bacterium]|jgi:ribosomal protein S18 acetylase RimI-like enzyme|nr:GNAT family N-acetyltransferase [Anaerolineales bacterium]